MTQKNTTVDINGKPYNINGRIFLGHASNSFT